MAIAFYIPDQEKLLRKANEQEQQILHMRETHWKYIACVIMDALRQYVLQQGHHVVAPTKGKFRKVKK